MNEQNFPKLEEVVKNHVLAAIELAGGNKAKAAGLLGVSIKTVYNHVNRYDGLESTSTPTAEVSTSQEASVPATDSSQETLVSGTNNIFG